MVNHTNSKRNFEAARSIGEFIRARGFGPSLNDMAATWGVRLTAAHRRFHVLRRLGLVSIRAFQNRTVQAIVPDKQGKRRAYFELVPALTKSCVRTTELRFICDGPSR